MIEKLGRRHTSAHVEIRPICQQSSVPFAQWKQQVAEFSEVQFSIVVGVMPTEKEVNVVMGKIIEAYVVSEGHYNVLN